MKKYLLSIILIFMMLGTVLALPPMYVGDTAVSLTANGANCSSGQAPLGVDATGAVEGCFAVVTPNTGYTGGQTIIGGTGTTDDLILRTTSGVGASGADMIFQTGNNGGTEAMRILYDGKVGIGTASPQFSIDTNAGTIGSTNNNLVFTSTSNNIYVRSHSSGSVILNDLDAGSVQLAVGGGNVGIGMTTIPSLFSIGSVTSLLYAVTNKGHVVVDDAVTASFPVISACGTTPALTAGSSDFAGKVTIGTGVTTACTITFGTAYTNEPSCVVTPQYSATAYLSASSATAITVTLSADGAGQKFNYHCVGINGGN